MCLIAAAVFLGLMLSAFYAGNIAMGILYALITVGFVALMLYNFKKAKASKKDK